MSCNKTIEYEPDRGRIDIAINSVNVSSLIILHSMHLAEHRYDFRGMSFDFPFEALALGHLYTQCTR